MFPVKCIVSIFIDITYIVNSAILIVWIIHINKNKQRQIDYFSNYKSELILYYFLLTFKWQSLFSQFLLFRKNVKYFEIGYKLRTISYA